MNAVKLLESDHRKVEELFKKFKENEDGRHAALFKKIKAELDAHTHIEEAVFYPKLLSDGDKELKTIVREGIEEHRQVKMFLSELAGMTATNKKFNPKLKVVVEDVEHHVEEEEKEMFPMVEDQFSTRVLENLGAAMEKERAKYQKAHNIKPSRSAPKKGAVATIMDKVKASVGGIVGGTATPAKRRGNGNAKKSKAQTTKAKPKRTTTAKPSKPTARAKAATRS